MKTAVSIPDGLYLETERYCRRTRRSRRGPFCEALSEYLARHSPDAVTEAMSQLCAEVGAEADPFVARAGRRALHRARLAGKLPRKKLHSIPAGIDIVLGRESLDNAASTTRRRCRRAG